MKNAIINLLDSIATQPDHPEDLAEYIEAVSGDHNLSPNIMWTLIAILAYRERKKWAWEIIQPHIPQEDGPDYVSITDVLESVETGIVNGHPEWEYKIDGNDSFVRNRITGEQIHIDVLNGPEVIPPYAFILWLQNNRTPVARRLLDLHPSGHKVSGEGVQVALEVLIEAGSLHLVMYDEFVLCGRLDIYESAMTEFADACSDRSQRLWLAASIGDWPLALDLATAMGQRALADLLGPLATECRAKWTAYLETRSSFHGLDDALLYALADANSEALSTHIEVALADYTRAAIDIIEDDPTWCARVYKHFCRAEHSKGSCASFLVRHGYRTHEVLETLANGDDSDLGRALELTVEYAPELLPEYLERALKASCCSARLTAAAILALLGDEWSHSRLIGVLEGSGDQDATIECRAALRESTDPAVRMAPDEWEDRHPDTDGASHLSDRYWYGLDGGCERVLRQRMDQLFESVMKVRQSFSFESHERSCRTTK